MIIYLAITFMNQDRFINLKTTNSKILLIINKILLVSFPGADYEVILGRTGEWIKGT